MVETKRITRPSFAAVDATKVSPTHVSLAKHRFSIADMHVDSSSAVSDDTKQAAALITAAAPTECLSVSNGFIVENNNGENGKKPLAGILTHKLVGPTRRRTSVGVG